MSRIILSEKEEIVNLVKARWRDGVRPDGTIIGVYRSEKYRREKMGMNPGASGNVDLIYSGDLSRGLTLNSVLNIGFSIFSTDYKAQHIAEKYGLDVYGLSEEELEDLFEMVAGRVIIEILNKSW